MHTARILIKQGNNTYRFMRFESSSDGSILVFMDRDPRSKIGSMKSDKDGVLVPDGDATDKTLPSTRFSIHTTGIVNRHSAGRKVSTHRIEPLYALTSAWFIGIISIPSITRLDLFDQIKHRHSAAACLEFPENLTERITFEIGIGPKPQTPQSFGVAFNYEIYSLIVQVSAPLPIKSELENHFVYGGLQATGEEKFAVDKAAAELNFYHTAHGPNLPPFREADGSYIVLAAVPMARTPDLVVKFNRPELSAEAIPFTDGSAPTHKVRFWICDKGGRNKKNDLRGHITSIELHAEL